MKQRKQFFLNYLNWEEIVLYIASSVAMDVDYQIYFIVSLFKHLEHEILEQSQDHNLLLYLRTEPIIGYNVSQYVEYFQELSVKYHTSISTDLQKTT